MATPRSIELYEPNVYGVLDHVAKVLLGYLNDLAVGLIET